MLRGLAHRFVPVGSDEQIVAPWRPDEPSVAPDSPVEEPVSDA